MEHRFHIVEHLLRAKLEGRVASSEFSHGTQAVDRAFALLITILESPAPLYLSDLAKRHELPKSTTSRLLAAMERQGVLQRDRSGAFLAGHILSTFAREQNQESILIAQIRPVLQTLAEETGETANLAVAGNGYINLIDQIDGHYLLGATNWVGRKVAYNASALGKVLLAFGVVSIPAGRLEQYTSATITSRIKLEDELERVRKVGYATIVDELEEGLTAVAAPVFDSRGGIIGAVSLSGPSPRMPGQSLASLGELISSELKKNSHQQKLHNPNKLGKVGAA